MIMKVYGKFEDQGPYDNIVVAGLTAAMGSTFTGFHGISDQQFVTDMFNDGFLALGSYGGSNTDAPRAYLNYMLFDENFVFYDAGFDRIDPASGYAPASGPGSVPFDELTLSITNMPVNGYIYIWLSNETEGTKVWFDDLSVDFTHNAVTEMTDYYPFGLVLRQQTTDSKDSYRFGYQGEFSEEDEETGWNAFELRMYDPVVGRWSAMDPYGQYFSPYQGMGNNPINGIDPDGAWVKGAGFWNNLFKSDKRIYAEMYAASWSSDLTDYFAAKIGDAWGIVASDNSYILTGHGEGIKYETFTTVNSDGSLGEMSSAFSYLGPSPGNIDFDPLTQLSLGFVFVGAPAAGARVGAAATTSDGFLFGSLTLRAPFNIPVQRFGAMSISGEGAWGLRLTSSQSVARSFNAILPQWNNLSVYTTGIIPKGTIMRIGITGPQWLNGGWRFMGGLPQINVGSRMVINQSSRFIR